MISPETLLSLACYLGLPAVIYTATQVALINHRLKTLEQSNQSAVASALERIAGVLEVHVQAQLDGSGNAQPSD